MKGKIVVILIVIVLLTAGIIGGKLLLEEKETDIIVTKKDTNEVAEIETESKVEEKTDEEIEWEMEFIEALLCQKNTYFSVVKNYNDNYYEILDKYCTEYDGYGGEAAAWVENESNYKQYTQDGNGAKLEKIADNINIKMAYVHESTCNLSKYNENMTLEDVLKLQSEEGTDCLGKLIGNNGYYEITGMLIMNGNNTSEEEWKNNSRAKKISVIIDGKEEYGFDLEDTMEVQLIDLNYRHNGLDTPIDVEIRVLDTYEGEVSDDVYIADIRFGLDTSIFRGR